MTLPEVAEVMHRRAHGRRPPRAIQAPVHASWRGSARQGAGIHHQTTVTFPEPGLYRVRVQLTSTDTARIGSYVVQNGVMREVWFWVTDRGGRMVGHINNVYRDREILDSPELSAQLIPPDCDDPTTCEPPPDDPDPPPPSNIISGQVVYLNYRVNSVIPLPNAMVAIYHGTNASLFNATTYTNGDGQFSLPCPPASIGTEGQIVVATDNAYVLVEDTRRPGGAKRDVRYVTGLSSADCGRDIGVIESWNPHQTEMFDNLTQTALRSRQQFGPAGTRGKIGARFIQQMDDVSFYVPATDTIEITEARATQAAGLFEAAHEYGRAVHEKALGGIRGFGFTSENCEVHAMHLTTNLGCAWIEGFANYHAFLLWTDLFPGFTFVNYNSYAGSGPPSDGPAREGAVAALLFDISDGTGSDFAGPGGMLVPFTDGVQRSPAEIADAMLNCRIDNQRVDGIDYLMHCFEKRVQLVPFQQCDVYGKNCRTVYRSERWIDRSAHNTYFRDHRGITPLTWDWGPLPSTVGHDPAIRTLWRCNLFSCN